MKPRRKAPFLDIPVVVMVTREQLEEIDATAERVEKSRSWFCRVAILEAVEKVRLRELVETRK